MMRFGRKIEDQKGGGLLEVLISMVLLSIGVLGTGLMIGTAIQGNVTANDNTVVTTLIKRQIEAFEALDSLPLMPLRYEEAGYSGIYDRITSLVDNTTDTTIPDGLCELTVTVVWAGQDDLKHVRTFSTYLVKP